MDYLTPLKSLIGIGSEPVLRRRRYLLVSALANLAVWVVALLFLAVWPRTYRSEWSLILPASNSDARVSLNDVGQAYTAPGSNYDAKTLDPRVNYKTILLSDTVLDEAARLAGIPSEEFNAPAIKLIDQSSIMEIKVSSSSPELARTNSNALLQAFQQRLTALRRDEASERDKGIEQAIQTSREKLETAQKLLTGFKVNAHIVSEKQLEEMALASIGLEKRRLELQAELARGQRILSSLSSSLGFGSETAAQIITLQGDALFNEHLKQFTTVTATLADYRYKWAASHPNVREAQAQEEAAFNAMTVRARTLLGNRLTPQGLRRLGLVIGEKSLDPLLHDLVNTHVGNEGRQAELTEINRQLAELKKELVQLAHETSQLDDLQRRLKFSEAIFSSTLGKTDIGNSNIFSSYPLVQTLVVPGRPLRPTSPKPVLVLLGAAFASLFLTTGLSLAWLRKKEG